MSIINTIYKKWLVVISLIVMCVPCGAATEMLRDSVEVDSIAEDVLEEDSALISEMIMKGTKQKVKRDWSTWKPSPKRAMWLAIVVPGAGQIYNRKYWKLPIFYGGFLGCYYAMRWNNMMYRDYSQGFIDLNDGNLETQSYNQFMHLGMKIDESKPSDVQRFSTKFKKRKDYYRRYRDMSAFILIGVYALSVIDAYVDASLSEFDISEDLSMKVSPTLMQNEGYTFNPVRTTSLGVHCSLTF